MLLGLDCKCLLYPLNLIDVLADIGEEFQVYVGGVDVQMLKLFYLAIGLLDLF